MAYARADIDVIIVHYHAAELVREAVDALQRDAAGSGLTVNIVVSDNGSTPEERALLCSLDVRYLPTGSDAGYAGGANYAFPSTTADMVILMNEDVLVLPGCLRELRAVLQSGAAAAGPEFCWDRDQIFLLPCTEERTRGNELLKVSGRRSLERLQTARQRWRHHARRHWQAAEPLTTTALSGALIAFRRDTWDAVGPWDEHYQMYFDENDWLNRIESAGLRSVYVPAAKAIHLHNPKLASDPDRSEWANESFLRFGNRYYGETFMRRLFRLGSRPCVVPDWKASAMTGIDLPGDGRWPLWVEVTPSPFGFPAAATQIVDPATKRWEMPPLRGLDFLSGTLFVQLVDDTGRELCGVAMHRAPQAAEVAAR